MLADARHCQIVGAVWFDTYLGAGNSPPTERDTQLPKEWQSRETEGCLRFSEEGFWNAHDIMRAASGTPRKANSHLTDVQPSVVCPGKVLNDTPPFYSRTPHLLSGNAVAGSEGQLWGWMGTWGRGRGTGLQCRADVAQPGQNRRTGGVLCFCALCRNASLSHWQQSSDSLGTSAL
ncbi:hypothetical protein MATL_G00064900 [Megalops atlanticus]|uniref:Uncharacterized protein n=1 Tax=Megalops atlanticus TaxID=7932 RepID=A0A9D3TAI3_MEGAT|nr:hypothetical protein MATL_G00064900 [Megalops atlanticus]